MYVFGGYSTTYLNDLYALDLNTFVWSRVAVVGKVGVVMGVLSGGHRIDSETETVFGDGWISKSFVCNGWFWQCEF